MPFTRKVKKKTAGEVNLQLFGCVAQRIAGINVTGEGGNWGTLRIPFGKIGEP